MSGGNFYCIYKTVKFGESFALLIVHLGNLLYMHCQTYEEEFIYKDNK